MKKIKGMVYTKDCVFVPGMIAVEADRIQEVSTCDLDELTQEERACFLIPGLVDVHFHGAAGYDFCDGTVEACKAIEDYENQNGITTICPATMSLPIGELEKIVKIAAQSRLQTLRGIHLEGPFISREKKGAQKEEYIIAPNKDILVSLQQTAQGLIKLVSLAPEIGDALECMNRLNGEFHFSIAHTMADYDMAVKAIKAGADHVTHLYNAMPTATHREPSVLGAAADCENVMVELICDGVHVHPSMVRNTFRIFGENRVILISDSMRATGMKDGNYTLGGQNVIVKGTLATLADGTIAGSVTNLYECMRKAVSMGIPKETAIKAATINPAKSIGIEKEVGSLEEGKIADILFVDEELNLQKVMVGGKLKTRM